VRRRFFVEQFEVMTAVMEGEAAHHLGRVLRAQTGQLYELSDGQHVWLARIENASRERLEFTLLEELAASQPTLDVTLLLSVVKFDAFEWALEKATELAVSRIVPLAAARSEKGLLAAASKRRDRWQKILLEASQQSRRVRVPVLGELSTLEKSLADVKSTNRILLSERSDAPALRKLLSISQAATSATLAIGPEGGWTDAELSAAQSANFAEASLGKLILRTETAVIAALAAINYALGAD
jgi:16S rRNA (uracil1498-N3)-methyltransferase